MSAKWKEDVNKLISKIESCKRIDASGNISFSGFEFDEYEATLFNFLDCRKEIPDAEKRKFLFNALLEAGQIGPITKDSVLQKIKDYEILYLKQHLEKYALSTSISIYRFTEIRRVRISNALVILETNLPKRFIKEAINLRDSAKNSIFSAPPTDYMNIRIHVSARSPLDAAEKSFFALDFFRGIWNLFFNRFQYSRKSSQRKPVNRLVLGPIHTLHFSSGKLATEMWWYDPDYQKALSIFRIKTYLTKLYKFEFNVRELINKIKYKDLIISSIIDYCRALDNRNWNTAFLMLWSVLEKLTHTGSDRYETTVRRASFLFKEREYNRQILNHLRNIRNTFVHDNKSSDFLEIYMYQLKGYVETLIEFHIVHGKDFENIEEASIFLDFQTEMRDIKRNIRLLNKAKNYLRT